MARLKPSTKASSFYLHPLIIALNTALLLSSKHHNIIITLIMFQWNQKIREWLGINILLLVYANLGVLTHYKSLCEHLKINLTLTDAEILGGFSKTLGSSRNWSIFYWVQVMFIQV